MSRNRRRYKELIFAQSSTDSRREKARDLWKFLGTQDQLKPYTPTRESDEATCTKSSDSVTPSKTVSAVAHADDVIERTSIWYDTLLTFHRYGLVKAALASETKCKFCIADKKMHKVTDLADTVMQTYDELNDEIRAFDERLRSVETRNMFGKSNTSDGRHSLSQL